MINGTKEMTQPCLVYLHVISLGWRSRHALQVMEPTMHIHDVTAHGHVEDMSMGQWRQWSLRRRSM